MNTITFITIVWIVAPDTLNRQSEWFTDGTRKHQDEPTYNSSIHLIIQLRNTYLLYYDLENFKFFLLCSGFIVTELQQVYRQLSVWWTYIYTHCDMQSIHLILLLCFRWTLSDRKSPRALIHITCSVVIMRYYDKKLNVWYPRLRWLYSDV